MFLIGCGGEKSARPDVTGVQTQGVGKGAFIAAADRLCLATLPHIAKAQARYLRIYESGRTRRSMKFYARSLALSEGTVEAVKDLPQPRDDHALLEDYFRAWDRLAEVNRDFIAHFEGRSSEPLSPLYGQAELAQDRFRELGTEYGFRICGGRPPSGVPV